MRTCENCGAIITQENTRAKTAQGFNRIKYCSDKCKREANNKRFYSSHKDEIVDRVTINKTTARTHSQRATAGMYKASIIVDSETYATLRSVARGNISAAVTHLAREHRKQNPARED